VTTRNQQPVLEPPVVEYLVSWIYRTLDKEEISYSRYLTNAFWLIGGVFMYLIAKKLLFTDAAVIATAYYLFVPMGVIISRSFQPDSLMMMLFLINLYFIINFFENQSTNRLLLATISTAFTLLLRPLVLFAIFCAFLALSIQKYQDWRKILNVRLVVFGGLSLLPAIIYYGYAIAVAGFMRWKVSTSFMPYLLTKKDFWLGWFKISSDVVGYTALLIAIIGFFFLRSKVTQYLIVGLAVGYGIFGIAFTYHIHTHPYYHIQLIPIVGLCIAPLLLEILQALRQSQGKLWWMPVSVILLISLYASYRQVRDTLYQTHMEDPGMAEEIGEIVLHSPHTVFVASYYGLPLEYYGEFGGAPWPVRIEDSFYRRPGERELSVIERINGFSFIPEYFVITNFDLYNRKHQDLKQYLEQDCSLLAEKEQYLIYSMCKLPTANE
jgi:4-amino-4-deoxy-L-arabinose transferase-like glycosyltransferase